MTAVRYLELAGDAPQLRAEHVELEALEAALAAHPLRGPRFRLLELTAAPEARLDWASIGRLRHKALQLLNGRLTERLLGNLVLRFEVSGAPRELRSTLDALRAQALVAAPMWVLDVELPRAPDAREVPALVGAGEALLTEDTPVPARRRIERAPPAPAHTVAAAQDALEELLSDALQFRDSASVGRALARDAAHANPKMVTTRARQRGQIFGVWEGNAYRYPAFQFDAEGQPRPETAELIAVLPRDADGSGRDAALWLFAPDAALDERTPAEVFVEDPARVITLARQRRDGDDALD
jgi:hypothetical protein